MILSLIVPDTFLYWYFLCYHIVQACISCPDSWSNNFLIALPRLLLSVWPLHLVIRVLPQVQVLSLQYLICSKFSVNIKVISGLKFDRFPLPIYKVQIPLHDFRPWCSGPHSTILIFPPSTILSSLRCNVFSGLLTFLKFVLTFVQVFYCSSF